MPWTGGSPAASTPAPPTSGPAPTFDSGPGGATASGGSGAAGTPIQAGGGTFNTDFTSPQGALDSLQKDTAQAGDLMSGLGNLIGQSPIGDIARGIASIPVVGGAAQALGNIPGGIAAGVGGAVGHTLDAVGGALENIPNPFTSQGDLQTQFDAIPDSPQKQAVQAAIAANPGDKEHLMFQAASAFSQTDEGMAAAVTAGKTGLGYNPQTTVTATTLADTVGEFFGAIGNLAKPLERVAAGVQHGGMDRMDAIDAVVNGQAVFAGGLGGTTGIAGSGIGPNVFSGGSPTQLQPSEQMAYDYWKSGQWSKDQALDFLTMAGAGASHDTGLQLAGHIALDPTVFGSLGASALAKLGVTGLALVSAASEAAKGAEAIGAGAKAAELAGSVAAEGEAGAQAAETGVKISQAFDAGNAGRAAQLREQVNVLAKIGRNQEVSDVVRWLGQHTFGALQTTDEAGAVTRSVLGQAAFVTRAIVDPLNAIGGTLHKGQAFVDLASDVVGKAYVSAFGDGPAAKMMKDLVDAAGGLGTKEGTAMRDLLQQQIGDRGANIFRRVAGQVWRDTMLKTGNAELLRASTPTADVERLIEHQQEGLIPAVTSSALNDQTAVLTEADKANLFDRMQHVLGPAPAGFGSWADVGAKWSGEQLSLMHGLTFSHVESQLVDIKNALLRTVTDSKIADRVQRIIHVNSRTLDIVSAQDLLKTLTDNIAPVRSAFESAAAFKAAKAAFAATEHTSLDELYQAVLDAQKQFPRLADYALDAAHKNESLVAFVKKLSGDVAEGNLPNVLREKELAALGPEIEAHQASIDGAWKLALRPTDDKLYGLRTDLQGNLIRGWDVYVDTVAHQAPYRGLLSMEHNIAGMPIVGKAIGKITDAIQIGGSTLGRHVDQSILEANVRQRFVKLASDQFGMTPEESNKVIKAIEERAQMGKQSTRSLTAGNIWEAMEPALPADVLHGGRAGAEGAADFAQLDKRSALNLTLKAWQGDLRYVGISQELTGAAKVLFGRTGENFAGQISEGLWRSMKFTYNAAFQVQQKAEMIVFSTLKGQIPAFGSKMSAEDQAWKQIMDNLAGTSINRIAATAAGGESEFGGIETLAQSLDHSVAPGTRSFLQRLADGWGSGQSKQIGYVRATAVKAGKDIKAAYETTDPGFWARDAAQRAIVAGHPLSDDQHALALLLENGFGGDVRVPSSLIPGETAGLMDNAAAQRTMMFPRDVGAMEHVNVDQIMKKANIPYRNLKLGTQYIKDDASLRRALASGDVKWEAVADRLSAMSYSPEHIAAIQRVVSFGWHDYFQDVAAKFHLSAKESVDIQSMARAAAKARGMSPVEFMAQQFAPRIGGKLTADELAAHLSILRAGPEAQPADLINQLADAFQQHLDPSALRQLEEHYAARGSGSLAESIGNRIGADAGPTSVEMEALRQYQGGGQIASGLNQGSFKPEALDNLFARVAPTTQSTTVYRAFSPERYDAIVSGGDTYSSSLFQSTSASPEVAAGFGPGRVLAIEVPAGSKVLDMQKLGEDIGQEETLLPRNATFDVVHNGDQVSLRLRPEAAAPEGFTVNPYEASAGHTLTMGLQRNGIYHVSSNSGVEGFGSLGDTIGQGRTSTLLDRARAQTYADRLQIAAEAAHGASTEHIMDSFEAAYVRSFGGDAEAAKVMEQHAGAPLAEWETKFTTPEQKYALVQRLDGGLTGPGVSIHDRIVKLNASFADAQKWDPAKFEIKQFASRSGVVGDLGQDTTSGEMLFKREDLAQIGSEPVRASTAPAAGAVEPGIEGTVQEFSKWTQMVMREGMFKASGGQATLSPALNDLFSRISGIPTKAASPFNRNEALIQSLAGQAIGKAEQDAFKLAYFQRDRTMFERSLNHPIFGIYPASYMWGKVAPELIKFMAQTPFGAETGALAYSLNDAKMAVAIQYEYDPAFRAHMESLGASPALFFLGYLLPGVPWDVNASAPPWMRNVAGQANLNQKLVDAGQAPKPIDLWSQNGAFQTETNYMNILRTPAMAAKAVTGVQDVVSGQAAKKGDFDQYSDAPAAAPTPGQTPNANAPGGLGPTLNDAMTSLQQLLSGQTSGQ